MSTLFFSLPVHASRTYVYENSSNQRCQLGISIFEREIKISQFADDTTLLCFDLSLVEKRLQIVEDFGEISGVMLNLEKTKAMWLVMWSGNKNKQLHLKWFSSLTRILGIYFYDEKGNNEMNFNTANKLEYMEVKRTHIIWEYVQLQISMFQRIVLITLRVGSSAEIKGTK